MQLKANGGDTKRDLFPKLSLHSGHLGDGFPLCADLPPRHFLARGARYSYLGDTPTARQQPEALDSHTVQALAQLEASAVPRLAPTPGSSWLHGALCRSSGAGAQCAFASEVELAATLPCHGDECEVDTVAVVAVHDPLANQTAYYEYVRRACVELAFFSGAVVRAASWAGADAKRMCADPATEAAAAACCAPGHGSLANFVAALRVLILVLRHVPPDVALVKVGQLRQGLTKVCTDESPSRSVRRCGCGGH